MITHNHLCADIGYMSLNHTGEQLCGDHIEIAGTDENSTVIVLADGLGSGVKASISNRDWIESPNGRVSCCRSVTTGPSRRDRLRGSPRSGRRGPTGRRP